MKYNTISTSSLAAEGRKSPENSKKDKERMYTESEVAQIRGELEIVQKTLRLQTRRCRHLVAQYTKKLQEKEQQYQSEKLLRNDQLGKVLRALLIFEARLKQEQKFLSHQLREKDLIIKKQSHDLQKLMTDQCCKNCKVYYSPSSNMESLESSSEYCNTDFHDNHSSNFESLDSSSETYVTMSEKEYNRNGQNLPELTSDNLKRNTEMNHHFAKNKKDSISRRKRIGHRKSGGTYFEVLKLHNNTDSPISNEDNTSNDLENLDSLTSENVTEKITYVSDRIENLFLNDDVSLEVNNSYTNVSVSESTETVVEVERSDNSALETDVKSKITETIPHFDGGETNDTWYASASDQEDDEHRDVYRDNPVLECMNQILLQNINDAISSPPKTPNPERKSGRNKKVKFQDEEVSDEEKHEAVIESESNGYYETPIQKIPNFYETPQSVCSSNYEQILLSKNEEVPKPELEINRLSSSKLSVDKTSHYYVDMDTKSENEEKEIKPVARKNKILRTPPALPPKPANLLSKYKIQILNGINKNDKCEVGSILESEPDYCSISELNLPIKKTSFKKINVIAEINTPPSKEAAECVSKANDHTYDPVIVSETIPAKAVKKNIDKFNEQLSKSSLKPEIALKTSPKTKSDPEIPKLPQVSEIIIPEESAPKQEERISYDNYVKNNTQVLKTKNNRTESLRHPIMIGSSVSSLISSFNKQQLISEISQKQSKPKNKQFFSSFENINSLEKNSNSKENSFGENFDDFDLSQNFEEFKLDDCEIEEYQVEDLDFESKSNENTSKANSPHPIQNPKTSASEVPPSDDFISLNLNSVKQLREKLEQQKKLSANNNNNAPNYEHFLECTGLSSKSILTPSRLLSNHKSMLKPKDVKLRSKVAKTNYFDKQNTIKYWSEPYI